MIKLRKRITNPMTIIAIFATLSETSAAVSLPFLEDDEKEIYVWFLISFPFYLLFLFFATLNLNYRSLYSPSDFESDEHFLKAMDKDDPLENSVSGKVSPRRNAQAPANQIGAPAALPAQHHIRLPEPLKDMHIIDARGMKNKTQFNVSLEKIGKPQDGQAHMILFLTGTKLEKSLRERILKFSRLTKKRGSATYCVAYDLNSDKVTFMDPSCQPASTSQ
ncbi:hypothetical protein PS918_04289 [Pseudomonas fluorescens]|uniref:Uncharacterized protein n=1 Tax=Pseudomonas fluorescens TaxID=294 RepID=A0A5E7TX48_PSEFL|nr:hypothetical protein [Pseudomonas fluorescens]VVQ02338.1 hypothetical protein PS918_04289 [Pseudomonas fluorescens]